MEEYVSCFKDEVLSIEPLSFSERLESERGGVDSGSGYCFAREKRKTLELCFININLLFNMLKMSLCSHCGELARFKCDECGAVYCGEECFNRDNHPEYCEIGRARTQLRTPRQKAKFERVLREFKHHKLRDSHGEPVTKLLI